MIKSELTILSKAVSHALRHEPWLYELELDDQGWVATEALLSALRSQMSEWKQLNKADLVQMIKTSSKQRHEIDGNHIRALYGHSLPGKLQTKVAPPPELLYHGTSLSIVDQIMKTGLLPMERQYVHLSVNIEIARQVGVRKDKKPVVLQINARKAYDSDVKFYMGNDVVWLADYVPSELIGIYNED